MTRRFPHSAVCVLLPVVVAASACTSLLGGPKPVDVRPVLTKSADDGNTDDTLYSSAVAAIGDRDYARALDYLQAAREKHLDDVRVLNAFGVVYDKLGRFDLSARYYAEAKAADPASKIVAANMAYSQVLQGLRSGDAPTVATAAAAPLREAPDNVHDRNTLTSTAEASLGPSRPSATDAAATAADATLMEPLHSRQANAEAPAIQSGVADPATSAVSGTPGAAHVVVHKPVLTGHPLAIVNASGKTHATEIMRRRLVKLGWTAPSSASRDAVAQRGDTVIFFGERNRAAARALARTLRIPVHLTARACHCGGLELVVGRDFLPRMSLAAAGDTTPNTKDDEKNVPAKT